MTAEIVDLGQYREQKDRAETVRRRRKTDRRAGDDDLDRLRDRRLDNDDSTQGGEPA